MAVIRQAIRQNHEALRKDLNFDPHLYRLGLNENVRNFSSTTSAIQTLP
ncbi:MULTISPECIES: hypothetical protein [Lactococcus]|nr:MULTISPECIES: hypothetical protein [Lactococcus]MDT2561976.1 hypothetical protein [Lactococcus petauri]